MIRQPVSQSSPHSGARRVARRRLPMAVVPALLVTLLALPDSKAHAQPGLQQPPAAPLDVAADSGVFSIDLPAALRLAERKNPTIAIAREAVLRNLAIQQQAQAMLFPTLVAGGNLHIHRGALQRDTGEILRVDSQSLYYGGGAGAVGAGTVGIPAVRIIAPLSDALFEPLVTRQRVAESRFDARATSNTILLDVALRYLALAGAQASLEAYREADSELGRVVNTIRAFVQVGQARKADLDRAQVRALFIRNAMLQAHERVAIASARLAQLLDLDPSVRLQTVSGSLQALQLVDSGYNLRCLIDIAMQNRPELAARSAAVEANRARLQEEQMRPWFPVISAGYSAGEFGGGSNLAPYRFDQFAPRDDFDVWAVWTLQNAGLGNLSRQRTRRAELDQAMSDRVRVVNRVQEEVAQAYALSSASRQQTALASQQETIARAGFQEEVARTRGGEGLPIEVLNSFELMVRARQDFISATTQFDQNQFRLFVALGSPPSVALPGAATSDVLPSSPRQ